MPAAAAAAAAAVNDRIRSQEPKQQCYYSVLREIEFPIGAKEIRALSHRELVDQSEQMGKSKMCSFKFMCISQMLNNSTHNNGGYKMWPPALHRPLKVPEHK